MKEGEKMDKGEEGCPGPTQGVLLIKMVTKRRGPQTVCLQQPSELSETVTLT